MLKKNTFWRSYLQLLIGTVVLSLTALLPWYARIIAAIIAIIIYKKFNKYSKIEPIGGNGLFVICLIPVVLYAICSYGTISVDFSVTKAAFVAIDTLSTVLWQQLFIIGMGTSFFGIGEDFKVEPRELIAIVGAFVISGIAFGLNFNLFMFLGIGVISLASYLATKSLDIPVAIHLLLYSITQISDNFISHTTLSSRESVILLIADSLVLIILGIWILDKYSLVLKEGEFNG